MLQRFGINLAAQGAEKIVFASRRGAVSVKLLTKIPERLTVLATPMPSFDVDSDFIVAVVNDGGEQRIETIHGTCPDWALEAHMVPPDAVMVAAPHQF